MRVGCLLGTHARHLSFCRAVAEAADLAAAVLQGRESMLPEAPAGLGAHDRENFVRHFENRAAAEERWFGNPDPPDCAVRVVDSPDELSGRQTVDFLDRAKLDLLLVFGTGMIRDPLFSELPCPTINLHLGLSPRYRGAATLFWPFFFLEPGWAGATFHYIVQEPDAGAVVHQLVPNLDFADRIHDVASKTVLAAARDVAMLLERFERDGNLPGVAQRGTGRNFRKRDFRPEHLRVIYDLFDDDLVAHYLEGRLPAPSPDLIRLS